MKRKTHSFIRTVSQRKGCGLRNNKPKHGWSKRRRQQLGWRA